MSKKRPRVPPTFQRLSAEAIAELRAAYPARPKGLLKFVSLTHLRQPGTLAAPGELNAGNVNYLKDKLGRTPTLKECEDVFADEWQAEREWFEAHRDELQAQIEERRTSVEGQAAQREGTAEDEGGEEEQAERAPSGQSGEGS